MRAASRPRRSCGRRSARKRARRLPVSDATRSRGKATSAVRFIDGGDCLHERAALAFAMRVELGERRAAIGVRAIASRTPAMPRWRIAAKRPAATIQMPGAGGQNGTAGGSARSRRLARLPGSSVIAPAPVRRGSARLDPLADQFAQLQRDVAVGRDRQDRDRALRATASATRAPAGRAARRRSGSRRVAEARCRPRSAASPEAKTALPTSGSCALERIVNEHGEHVVMRGDARDQPLRLRVGAGAVRDQADEPVMGREPRAHAASASLSCAASPPRRRALGEGEVLAHDFARCTRVAPTSRACGLTSTMLGVAEDDGADPVAERGDAPGRERRRLPPRRPTSWRAGCRRTSSMRWSTRSSTRPVALLGVDADMRAARAAPSPASRSCACRRPRNSGAVPRNSRPRPRRREACRPARRLCTGWRGRKLKPRALCFRREKRVERDGRPRRRPERRYVLPDRVAVPGSAP